MTQMTHGDVAKLLAVAAAFDRRTVGQADVHAWHSAIGALDPEDVRDAIVAHYQAETRFVMPADLITRVQGMRLARLEAAGDLVDAMIADGLDPDDPAWHGELRHRRQQAMLRHPSTGPRLLQGGGR